MTAASVRLRTELRDLFEVVLVPGLAAVLPWPVCYRIFRRLARLPWLYREASDRALAEARARGWVGDEAHWLHVRRLVTLVDHADYYLGRFRGDRWMRRYLKEVDGAWPEPGRAQVVCSFHWGAGMWGLRHLAASGLKAHALVASLDPAHFKGRSVLFRYARARTAEVERALGQPSMDAWTNLRPALRALRAGEQLAAAVDVPSDQAVASETIDLFGGVARVPRGLFRLAVEQKLPVTVFVTGIRLEDGSRFLRIRQLGTEARVDTLIRRAYELLDEAVRESPPAWHLWGEAPRFFNQNGD